MVVGQEKLTKGEKGRKTGEKGRKTVAVQPLTLKKKTVVCQLPFHRSTRTARGELHEQKPHHRALGCQLCSEAEPLHRQ